jgi:hypothetical protein
MTKFESRQKAHKAVEGYYYSSIKSMLRIKGKPSAKKLLGAFFGDMETYMKDKLTLILQRSTDANDPAMLGAKERVERTNVILKTTCAKRLKQTVKVIIG